MSILNFRKQRQYTKNKSGQYDLVSNWTSAETVYDRDGHCVMERLDNALLPMVDGTDNGKLLTVKNGGWTKDMVIPNVDSEDDGKVFTVKNGEWAKDNIVTDKVKQTPADMTTSDEYSILLAGSWQNTTIIEKTEGTQMTSQLRYSPKNKRLAIGEYNHMYADRTKTYIYDDKIVVAKGEGYDTKKDNTFTYDDIVLSGTNNTWDGTNASLKDAIGSCKPSFTVRQKTIAFNEGQQGIPAHTEKLGWVDPTLEGYTVLGVVGWSMGFSDLDDSDKPIVREIRYDSTNNLIYCTLYNAWSQTLTGQAIYVNVLYVSN